MDNGHKVMELVTTLEATINVHRNHPRAHLPSYTSLSWFDLWHVTILFRLAQRVQWSVQTGSYPVSTVAHEGLINIRPALIAVHEGLIGLRPVPCKVLPLPVQPNCLSPRHCAVAQRLPMRHENTANYLMRFSNRTTLGICTVASCGHVLVLNEIEQTWVVF